MQPLVSICIPVYNGEKHLMQCLDSAISQSYLNTEIIITDDGSTDNSLEIIKKYALLDSRIKLFVNSQNLGLVNNWNHCMEHTSGEWIKFLFQDDYLAINCIEKMLTVSETEDNLIVCKRTFIVDKEADATTKKYYENDVRTFKRLGIPDKQTFITAKMISNFACENICLNFIGEPTSIFFRKKIITEVGLFNNDLAQICDLEFALRIGTRCGLRYIPEPLSFFRIHESSTTSSNLADKNYVLSHLDPIITIHQLLYAACYSTFRLLITIGNKIKLEQFFEVRVFEAYTVAKTKAIYLEQFEKAAKNYSHINEFITPGILTRIKFMLVLMRRKLRKAVAN